MTDFYRSNRRLRTEPRSPAPGSLLLSVDPFSGVNSAQSQPISGYSSGRTGLVHGRFLNVAGPQALTTPGLVHGKFITVAGPQALTTIVS
jgi:hypothetical protein